MKNHESPTPKGIVIFNTLAEAVRSGFELFEKTSDGFVVRMRTERGYALAFARDTSPVQHSRY